jgi:hypothetical protein
LCCIFAYKCLLGSVAKYIIFVFLFISSLAFADDYSFAIRGTYHKKNLLIENPYSYQYNQYSITKIVLNNSQVNINPKSSVIEVNLSHLKENDSVVVVVFHRKWGKPKAINFYHLLHENKSEEERIDIYEGYYFDKPIFFESPYNDDDECIKSVWLNGKKIKEQVKTSAFQVDPEKFGVIKGQKVKIEIKHHPKCKPKLLNPQVIRLQDHFVFENVSLKGKLLEWKTLNEKTSGVFFVEHFFNENWVVIQEVKITKPNGKYGTYVEHISGDNIYRIKYVEELPYHEETISISLEHFEDTKPCNFYPQNVEKKLHLTKETYYEITDDSGKHITYGRGIEIDVSNYTDGVYMLYFDNEIGKFYKKK